LLSHDSSCRIASHRIASHRIASHRIAHHPPVVVVIDGRERRTRDVNGIKRSIFSRSESREATGNARTHDARLRANDANDANDALQRRDR